MATTSEVLLTPHQNQDFMPLHGIDHVELWVGNATQASYFFRTAFGFDEVAYSGLETGQRDRVSRVLRQGEIRLVLTGTLRSETDVTRHHAQHGDGVKVIAITVPDVEHAYREATARGAEGLVAPHVISDDSGSVGSPTSPPTARRSTGSSIARATAGAFLPGFASAQPLPSAGTELLGGIDHIVGNVELGAMNQWVSYYEDVFGMTEMIHFTDEAISTEYSALMSKVVTGGDGRVKFPINEPAEGRRKSQIDEYLEFYEGPGAQHIALTTGDIVRTVAELRERGIRFLQTPDSYYEEVPGRVGEIEESLEDLRRLGILVDRDDEGYLLQIFTAPLGDRPTIFFEIIERHGATRFRGRKLQGAVRGDRARAGQARGNL